MLTHRSPKMIGAKSEKTLSALTRWAITIGVNIGSVYLLDLIAVVCGVSLIMLLSEFWPQALEESIGCILLFLACSYAILGYTLSKNLKANWQLLEETGASTNVLSKAAYDFTKAITKNSTAQKVATGAGYALTELAKEIPYYAGAFGAAASTEAVTTKASLLFLAGANLGAALYEYALALGTSRVVSFVRKDRASARTDQSPSYSSFESDRVPKDYLDCYYNTVCPDEVHTIRFFVEAVRQIDDLGDVLFFGAGPTLHHVFLAAPKARTIHLADYLPANNDELRRWLERDSSAHG